MMNNFWSDHELKAAEYAKRAAMHYTKAAEYNDSGKIEKALHHALLAATDMDYSTQHAKLANDYCFKIMMDDMLEI
jgi:hypothetical protein